MTALLKVLEDSGVTGNSLTIQSTIRDAQGMLRGDPVTDAIVAKTLAKSLNSICAEAEGLPKPVKLADWLAKEMPQRPEVIHGMLRKGDKLTLGGASKSKKTWCAAHMGLCVSAGVHWLGIPTVKAPVLYLNLELPEDSFHSRMGKIADAAGINTTDADFTAWNLRGKQMTIERLATELEGYTNPIGLLIVDPLYKILGDRVENDAGAMAELMGQLEAVATKRNCALVIPAHFSKGNQSEKSSIDRIAGSGVFGRDADAIVSMTEHEEPECLTVESTLRSFRPMDSFVIRWEFPLFQVAHDLDPENLKKRVGRKKTVADDDLIALLGESGLTHTNWKNAADDRLQMKGTTFKDRVRTLLKRGVVQLTTHGSLYTKATR